MRQQPTKIQVSQACAVKPYRLGTKRWREEAWRRTVSHTLHTPWADYWRIRFQFRQTVSWKVSARGDESSLRCTRYLAPATLKVLGRCLRSPFLAPVAPSSRAVKSLYLPLQVGTKGDAHPCRNIQRRTESLRPANPPSPPSKGCALVPALVSRLPSSDGS